MAKPAVGHMPFPGHRTCAELVLPKVCDHCGKVVSDRNSSGSCQSCANRRRTYVNAWTDNHIAFLRSNYAEQGAQACADHLGRSVMATRTKANELGLRVSRSRAVQARRENSRKPRGDNVQIHAERRHKANARKAMAKAIALAEQGVEPGSLKRGQARTNLIHAQRIVADRERQMDPIEQAKRKLQRKWPVYSMKVHGGPADLFVVGNRKGLTANDLLALAEAA